MKTESISDQSFDVVIIGGGVVGAAVLRRFVLAGAKALLIEKADDVLDGASKANSAILHTGFDAPPGTLEQACIRDGYEEFMRIRERLDLPITACGAYVIAWTAEQADQLPSLIEKAHLNGVDNVTPLSSSQIARKEPNVAAGIHAGFEVPGEAIIDPWTTPHAYFLDGLINGGQVARGRALLNGEFDGTQWHLTTTREMVKTKLVINAAGLHGDTVEQRLLGHSRFNIRPRKGQFLVYDKAASQLINGILLPVPTAHSKGIVVTRTVYGNVLVGPTAEDQPDRDDWSTNSATLRFLREQAETIIPSLAEMPVTATYAGLRPATENSAYQVHSLPERAYIAACGIRSTGLSAALGIANYVLGLHEAHGGTYDALREPKIPSDIPQIAESARRDWQKPGNDGIVCHCELVTQREIIQALEGPLAAQTLAGLKRLTRVTMGRCQGFYCTGRLASLTRGAFVENIAESYSQDNG